MKMHRKVLVGVGAVLALVAVGVGVWFLVNQAQERQEAAIQKEIQDELVALMSDPEALYDRVVEKAKKDAKLRSVDYKSAEYTDSTLKAVREFLDGQSLTEHLKEFTDNPDNAEVKRANSAVLKLLQDQGEKVVADLGITPNDRYSYFLVHTDVVLDDSYESVDEALQGFVEPFGLLCERTSETGRKFDCKQKIAGKDITTQYITLYAFKVSDNPTTYRIYGFLRSTTK